MCFQTTKTVGATPADTTTGASLDAPTPARPVVDKHANSLTMMTNSLTLAENIGSVHMQSSSSSPLSSSSSHCSHASSDLLLATLAVAAMAYNTPRLHNLLLNLRKYRITIRVDEEKEGEASVSFLTIISICILLGLLTSRRVTGCASAIVNFAVNSLPSSLSFPSARSTSSQSLPRASSRQAIYQAARNIRRSIDSYKKRSTLQALSSKECFLRLDRIKELSVSDIASIFQFIQQKSGNKDSFVGTQHQQHLRDVVTAMDLAVSISRGSFGVPPIQDDSSAPSSSSSSSSTVPFCDVDALQFIAVTRIFAEWRAVRLTPAPASTKGKRYMRYEAALALAHRDALYNLAKVERAVHGHLKYRRDMVKQQQQASSTLTSSSPHAHITVPSPTLRELLMHEAKTIKIHPNLPQLTEDSAANGMLWTIRQLQYQQASFANLLRIPDDFPTFKEAGLAAYAEVYEPYHGWAVRQMFSHSFGGTPPANVIWSSIQPHAPSSPPGRKLTNSSESVAVTVNSIIHRADSKDDRGDKNEFLEALDQLGKHIAYEWDKFLGLFNCVDDKERRHSAAVSVSGLDLLSFVPDNNNDQMELARSNVQEHLGAMEPILGSLTELLENLNMNDPSRV